MATKAQLEAQGRNIAKRISDIQSDEKMTGAEKSAALDAIKPEYEDHVKALETSAAASEMASKLAGFGDLKDADGNLVETAYTAVNPFSAQARHAIARQIVQSKAAREIQTKGAYEGMDLAMEIDTKDATESNNLMGAQLYGGTGPTAIGQNPFGSDGAFSQGIMPLWQPGIVEKLFYELTLADLISSFPTTAPNISYLTESTFNSQATDVAEAGAYPFSSVEVARAYEQVAKIANAMTLTDEAIADAPQLFNFAQGRLLLSLQRQEEVQLLAGPGGGAGVNGLLNRASSFTASSSASLFGATSATGTNVAFPPAGTNGASVVSQTISSLAYGRKVTGASGVLPTASAVAENLMDAFVDLELAVFQKPNAVVMHPRDWETLRLAKDQNDQYYGGSFFGNNYGYGGVTGKSIWNTPVVTTPLIPAHTILVGWFDPSVLQIARREGVKVQMTNSNGTDFVNGKVTVRAEERLGLLVYRPTAFQLIQLVAGA